MHVPSPKREENSLGEVIQGWDLAVLSSLRDIHHPAVVWTAWLLSSLAWKGVFFWLLAGVLWLRGHRLIAAQMAIALLVGTLEIGALKGMILRPRPDLYASQQLNIPMPELLGTTHSFPSGHTTLAASIAAIVWVSLRDWRTVAACVFVVLVGAARVYQGMHWPSDILGSLVLGAVAGYIAVSVTRLPWVAARLTPKSKRDTITVSTIDSQPIKEKAGVR